MGSDDCGKCVFQPFLKRGHEFSNLGLKTGNMYILTADKIVPYAQAVVRVNFIYTGFPSGRA